MKIPVKFLLTNWVTVLLLVIGVVGYIVYSFENSYLREMLLTAQLKELNLDIEKMKEEREKLKARVKELEAFKLSESKETLKLRKSLPTLSSDEKKQKLLAYKNRLMVKRGIK